MKLSISLPAEDVAALDAFAQRAGLSSRSAALQHAIRLLRHPDLEQDYEAAWQEWDAERWDGTAGDGLADAAR